MKKILSITLLSLAATVLLPKAVLAYAPPPASNLLLFLTPKLQITLPAVDLVKPSELVYKTTTYRFQLTPTQVNVTPTSSDFRVTARYEGLANQRHIVISVLDIKPDDSSVDNNFRLTFQQIPQANMENASKDGYSGFGATQTGASCKPDGSKTHLCLRSNVLFRTREFGTKTIPLQQSIPLKAITVAGNVAGETLKGFSISPESIAVGNTVDITGGTQIGDYFKQSKLVWGGGNGTIGGEVLAAFNKRSRGFSMQRDGFTGCANGGNTWNLNALSQPCDSATALTLQPEGKLWSITRRSSDSSADTFLFGWNDGNGTKFSGSGTLVFDRSIDVNGPISCEPDARLGVLVRGTITFRTTKVDCGAWVAFGNQGDIRMRTDGWNPESGSMQGIFVAEKNIVLPDPNKLKTSYNIQFDAKFAANPTVLMREILSFIGTQ